MCVRGETRAQPRIALETAWLEYWRAREFRVAVKCVDIRRNIGGEGDLLANYTLRRESGANRIRYPGSPRRKR